MSRSSSGMSSPTFLPGKSAICLPHEIVKLIVDQLHREDLSQARHINKAFADVAAPPLFETIPLWLSQYSLQSLTELSQHVQLRHYVKEIVFSPLRLVDQEDEHAYLSSVKSRIRLSSDSASLTGLLFVKHKSAYRAFRDSQRQLTKTGLDVGAMTHAFKRFPCLESLVLDHENREIGANWLLRELGFFRLTDLLTYDCYHSFPTLLRALSTARVFIKKFVIGNQAEFKVLVGHNASFVGQGLDSLDPTALVKAVWSTNLWQLAKTTFSHLETFEYKEIFVEEDDTGSMEQLRLAVKQILGFSKKLQSITIAPIGEVTPADRSTMLYVFGRYQGSKLRHLDISDMNIDPQYLVEFLRSKASTLQGVTLRYIWLENATWLNILDDLKSTNFPMLQTFNLIACRDNNHEESSIEVVPVREYLLGRAIEIPLFMP